MKMRWIVPVLAAVSLMLLSGCDKKSTDKGSGNDPVTITVWHYYNGVQKEGFDSLVQAFNENEGRKNNVVVKAFNKGSIDELSAAVSDSIDPVAAETEVGK